MNYFVDYGDGFYIPVSLERYRDFAISCNWDGKGETPSKFSYGIISGYIQNEK